MAFCAVYIQLESQIEFSVKKTDEGAVQLIKVPKSTSQGQLYFICYKQQIKNQALTALHFTATTINQDNCAFFPCMIVEW